MSASLVGSEMCIRDRLPTSPTEAPSAFATAAATGVAVARAREEQDEAGAVSYTHLTLPTICSV
eukprot:15117907-Alexandrium_andersonii.AAC.1